MVKWFAIAIFALVSTFFLADLLVARGVEPVRVSAADVAANGVVPAFKHSLHGDSIGLTCAACHTGAFSAEHAYFPSKAECLDCHRLPLTEKPGIETLDSALAASPENPWLKKSTLPEHVVFHHGVHHAAKVECADCHGQGYTKDSYGGERFDMQTCVNCHRGVTFKERNFKAAVYCAACHR